MNDDELFEARLKGALPEAERISFDERLHADPRFATRFSDFRAAVAIIETAGEHRLKEQLQAIHSEVIPIRQKGRVLGMAQRTWMAAAASLLIGLVAAYFHFTRSESAEELYAEHIAPYPAPDRLRDDAATSDAWSRFADLYAAGRYDEALSTLDSVAEGRVPGYLSAFYQGACHLLKARPDPERAKLALNITLLGGNDLHAAARWYMAMACLKSDDGTGAREHLRLLLEEGGYKREEAEELLRALPGP